MKYLRLFLLTAAAGFVLLIAFREADDDQQADTDTGIDDTVNAAPVQTGDPAVKDKMNGVSFVAPPEPVGAESMKPIRAVNANWVAIIPYAFGKESSPEIRFNVSRQWWGEREEGVAETIRHAEEMDLKVMLKPHVWVRGQGWVGDFELAGDAEWQQWEANYRAYIISYARVADSLDVAMYCIGTEYRKAVRQRPDFWRGLIKGVREVYDGELTYAANWDNYQNVGFWDELDYIGVDAYFPISEQKKPDVAHLNEQWQPVKQELKAFSSRHGKPVLFTEFGYQSIDHTADGHWKYEEDQRGLNLQAQSNAYQALFETFWDEPWFAGGFLWKWFAGHPKRGGPGDDRYTPQNKPAEEMVREWYGRE